MTQEHLPQAFGDLQVWVKDWALKCEEERFVRLHSVSHQELSDFYHAMLPRKFWWMIWGVTLLTFNESSPDL